MKIVKFGNGRHGVTQPKLWKTVLFVDWHGVLSNSVFWEDLSKKTKHPLFPLMQDVRRKVFDPKGHIAYDWMTGKVHSKDLLASLTKDKISDRRYHPDFLYRELLTGCQHSQLNKPLLSELRRLSTAHHVVIATDNMDCFTSATLPIISSLQLFDGIISSSDIGVLKSESPLEFFGVWLKDHALDFSQAILLDDSGENCEAFRRVGGRAVQVRSFSTAAAQARSIEV